MVIWTLCHHVLFAFAVGNILASYVFALCHPLLCSFDSSKNEMHGFLSNFGATSYFIDVAINASLLTLCL